MIKRIDAMNDSELAHRNKKYILWRHMIINTLTLAVFGSAASKHYD